MIRGGLFHLLISLAGLGFHSVVKVDGDLVLVSNQATRVNPEGFRYGVLRLRNAFEMREQVITLELPGMMFPWRVGNCLSVECQALVLFPVVPGNSALNVIYVGPKKVFCQ